MDIKVSKNIRQYRKNKHYTLRHLSQIAGIHYVTLSNYEKGKKIPKLKTLKKIASALGVKVSDLIEEDEG